MNSLRLLRALEFARSKHERLPEPHSHGLARTFRVLTLLTEVGRVDHIDVMLALITWDLIMHTTYDPNDDLCVFGRDVKELVKESFGSGEISERAKLVQLTNYLCTLKDLIIEVPADMTRENVESRLSGARLALERGKGVNRFIEDELKNILRNHSYTYEGVAYPCTPRPA